MRPLPLKGRTGAGAEASMISPRLALSVFLLKRSRSLAAQGAEVLAIPSGSPRLVFSLASTRRINVFTGPVASSEAPNHPLPHLCHLCHLCHPYRQFLPLPRTLAPSTWARASHIVAPSRLGPRPWKMSGRPFLSHPLFSTGWTRGLPSNL